MPRFVVSSVSTSTSCTFIVPSLAPFSTVDAVFKTAAVLVVLNVFSCDTLDAVLNLFSSEDVLVIPVTLFKSLASRSVSTPSNKFKFAALLVTALNVFISSVLGAEPSVLSCDTTLLTAVAAFSSDAVLVTATPDNFSVAASISVDAKSANKISEP